MRLGGTCQARHEQQKSSHPIPKCFCRKEMGANHNRLPEESKCLRRAILRILFFHSEWQGKNIAVSEMKGRH